MLICNKSLVTIFGLKFSNCRIRVNLLNCHCLLHIFIEYDYLSVLYHRLPSVILWKKNSQSLLWEFIGINLISYLLNTALHKVANFSVLTRMVRDIYGNFFLINKPFESLRISLPADDYTSLHDPHSVRWTFPLEFKEGWPTLG